MFPRPSVIATLSVFRPRFSPSMTNRDNSAILLAVGPCTHPGYTICENGQKGKTCFSCSSLLRWVLPQKALCCMHARNCPRISISTFFSAAPEQGAQLSLGGRVIVRSLRVDQQHRHVGSLPTGRSFYQRLRPYGRDERLGPCMDMP